MAEATMAIIRDFQKQVDVMKVEILENSDNPTGKPIYALGELKWGAFRDVEERIGKYWLWGPLKSYAAYFFGAFKSLTWDCNAQFHYTVPCEGCNNCMRNNLQDANELKFGSQVQNTRWWHAFIPRTKSVKGDNIHFIRSLHYLNILVTNFSRYKTSQRLFKSC